MALISSALVFEGRRGILLVVVPAWLTIEAAFATGSCTLPWSAGRERREALLLVPEWL